MLAVADADGVNMPMMMKEGVESSGR